MPRSAGIRSIVDPETVGSELAELVHDLPAGSPRLTAEPIGVRWVLVNPAVTEAELDAMLDAMLAVADALPDDDDAAVG